jgi:HAD superfamily hydrolase (TIGR01509 family)
VIKAVVFDFDGVLADSEPLHLQAYQAVLPAMGIDDLTREEYYRDLLGYNDEDCFRIMARSRGWEAGEAQVVEFAERKGLVFERIIAETDTLYAGAAACVERMAAAFPLGIASGAKKPEILQILRASGLDRCFRFVVASGDTPNSKPAPDPYIRAAERHALPPADCVAIEDSRWGLESARAAGLRTVGITHTYPADQLAMADVVIESLSEFTPELVKSL